MMLVFFDSGPCGGFSFLNLSVGEKKFGALVHELSIGSTGSMGDNFPFRAYCSFFFFAILFIKLGNVRLSSPDLRDNLSRLLFRLLHFRRRLIGVSSFLFRLHFPVPSCVVVIMSTALIRLIMLVPLGLLRLAVAGHSCPAVIMTPGVAVRKGFVV